MKLDDDWKNKIDLAGFKGHQGLERLAKYRHLLKNPNSIQRLDRMLDSRIPFAPDPHPYPTADADQLPITGWESWAASISADQYPK